MNPLGYLALHPLPVFFVSFGGMWLAAWIGNRIRHGRRFPDDQRQDFAIVLAATLTLLGLLIGFSFSMASSRYDQRKNLEEEEANAIGTEYQRADLLDAATRDQMRAQLVRYLDLRIRHYAAILEDEAARIAAETRQLQSEMWSTVAGAARQQRDPVTTLAVSGMNDVINSQGYSQAAWWNRIPTSAVLIMSAIALGANLLVGYGSPSISWRSPMLAVFPLLIALALTLVADIDTPRNGMIKVVPRNLVALQESLKRP